MSQKSQKQLDDALSHVRKHADVCKARIRRDVSAALMRFQQDTGCTVTELGIDTIEHRTVGKEEPETLVTTIYMRITRKGQPLN